MNARALFASLRWRGLLGDQVAHLNRVPPSAQVFGQKLGNQPAVALLRARFRAQQGQRAGRDGQFYRSWKPTFSHEREERGLVLGPILNLAIRFSHFRRRGQQRLVPIVYARNPSKEELQVGVFCVTGKLAAAVLADVYDAANTGLGEQ